MKDAIIIGKGPAGISAALYLKRAALDVLVIGKDYGSLDKSERIENYYGMDKPVPGRDLVETGIRQAQSLGIEVLTEEVVDISENNGFEVKTPQNSFQSKLLLLATGKPRTTLRIDGLERLRGKGVSFCAVCDGFFYRGKKIAVIGNGDFAAQEVGELLRFSKDVTLFTNGLPLQTHNLPKELTVVTDKIVSITGDDRVDGIVTEQKRYAVDGVFVAIGTASAADFAIKLGVLMDDSDIQVDDGYRTNIPGLYAAGDAVGGFLQIAKSVSDGAHAAKSMIHDIKK